MSGTAGRYEVTPEDCGRFEGVANEEASDDVQECVAKALQDFADRRFKPLTDEQIAAGIKAAAHTIGDAVTEALETHSRNNQEFCAHIKSLQIAAFREAAK